MASSTSNQEENDEFNDQLQFKWLQSGTRGTTYTSYNEFKNLPACSFDFGADGYAGSLNHGGELLQMTAPSNTSGIIFARGDFDYSLYSYLARAQRMVGGKSSFGLKLAPDQPQYNPSPEGIATTASGSSFRLGSIIERGCFNYRWPVHQYSLLYNEEEVQETGTCTFFSFVKDGILYQLLHLEQVCLPEFNTCYGFPPISGVTLRVGGPINFQMLNSTDADTDTDTDNEEEKKKKKGKVRSFRPDTRDEWQCDWQPDGFTSVRLKAKVFQLDKDGKWQYVPFTRKPDGRENSEDLCHTNSCEYEVTASLPEAKYTGYKNRRATFLAAFRLSDELIDRGIGIPPSPQQIYQYVGVSPSNTSCATGAMWQTIFLERVERNYNISELSEVCLIARCLEKILQVDLIPTTFSRAGVTNASHSLAVVSNLFIRAEVDLKALFWKVRFLIKAHNLLSYVTKGNNTTTSDDASPFEGDISPDNATRSSKDHQPKNDFPGRKRIHSTKDSDNSAQIKSHDDSPGKLNNPLSWKVRSDSESHDYDAKNKHTIAVAQLTRIKNAIQRIFTFLYDAYLMPDSNTPLSPNTLSAGKLGRVDYYYVMITIWYVVKNYPRFEVEWIPSLDNSYVKTCRLASEDGLPPDEWTFGQDTKLRIMLLHWYHYGSILRLSSHKDNNRNIKGAIPAGWRPHNLGEKVRRLRTEAKVALAARISSRQPYTAKDEIVDRLAFLAEELDLEDDTGTTGTIATLVVKRIKQREFTTEINPGPELLLSSEETSIHGPWEIHALCHHSRLLVAHLDRVATTDQNLEEKCNDEVETYRRKFCKFLTSDASLVPCWERTNLTARRGWLRSEATSVLASTLLEICEFDMSKSSAQEAKFDMKGHLLKTLSSDILSSPVELPTSSLSVYGEEIAETIRADVFQGPIISDNQLLINQMMKKQMEVLERFASTNNSVKKSSTSPIEWEKYGPPRQYHPDDFFNSLSRTPERYRRDFTRKVRVPSSLHSYLLDFSKDPSFGAPEWKTKRLDITGSLVSMSVIDIKACAPESKMRTDYTEPRTEIDTGIGQYRLKIAGMLKNDAQLDMLDSVKKPPKGFYPLPWTSKDVNELSSSLSESLVDQGVQHRILITPQLHSDVAKVLVYILHPESVDCLNNHALRFSRFSYQRKDPWMLGITLRSWSRVPKAKGTKHTPTKCADDLTRQQFGENMNTSGESVNRNKGIRTLEDYDCSVDDRPIFLPDKLKCSLIDRSTFKEEDQNPSQVELNVSSFVIKTNDFGDFSKCTIISEIIPSPRLRRLGYEAQIIWQRFIHQPQTARCLVFLLILGLMCQEMAERFKDAIKYFVSVTHLNDFFERDENEWVTGKDSLAQLKLALWSLESLCKLQSSLEQSMKSINYAKAELMAQINQVPGKRSEALERMHHDYLETFERSLGELALTQWELGRKIELNSRYRDAVSTVLALSDSRNSVDQNKNLIRQGRTIQKLTYLTIAYLPIGLAAAIFTIPNTQNVIKDGLGWGWFVGSSFIMMLVTFAIAIFLSPILKILPDPVGEDGDVRKPPGKVPSMSLGSFKLPFAGKSAPKQRSDGESTVKRKTRSFTSTKTTEESFHSKNDRVYP